MTTPTRRPDEIILDTALNIIRMAIRVEAQSVISKGSLDPSSGILEIMEHIRTCVSDQLLRNHINFTITHFAIPLGVLERAKLDIPCFNRVELFDLD